MTSVFDKLGVKWEPFASSMASNLWPARGEVEVDMDMDVDMDADTGIEEMEWRGLFLLTTGNRS